MEGCLGRQGRARGTKVLTRSFLGYPQQPSTLLLQPSQSPSSEASPHPPVGPAQSRDSSHLWQLPQMMDAAA